jgi:hypothetical protein
VIDVVFKNTGNEVLDIASIDTAAIAPPFSIVSDDCSNPVNASLLPVYTNPLSTCIVTLRFLPVSTGRFTDDLIITYKGQSSNELFSVKHPLIGEGGIPEINVEGSIEITSEIGGFSTTKDIIVSNTGQASVLIDSISDLSSTDFSQFNNCTGSNNLIAPGNACTISIKYTASDSSVKAETLSIVSNDPNNNVIDIMLTGYGESDADGVTTDVEDASPNSGDNNFDGVIDSIQNAVASLIGNTGDYITLVVDDSHVLSVTPIVSTLDLIELPHDVSFKQGAVEFDVAVDLPGEIVEIGMILPLDTSLTGYYFFDETVSSNSPRWFEYQQVQVIPRAKLSVVNGMQIEKSFLKILVQDGGVADSDGLVNGRVVLSLGAPAYSQGGSAVDASSSMNNLFLLLLAFIMVAVKINRHYGQHRR